MQLKTDVIILSIKLIKQCTYCNLFEIKMVFVNKKHFFYNKGLFIIFGIYNFKFTSFDIMLNFTF